MKFENIKSLRKDKDLTQREVADYLGMASNTYCQYEKGMIAWTDEHLLKLAKFYNVSVDYLMDLKDRDYIDKGKQDRITRDLLDNMMIMSTQEKQKLLALIPHIKNNTK